MACVRAGVRARVRVRVRISPSSMEPEPTVVIPALYLANISPISPLHLTLVDGARAIRVKLGEERAWG